MVEFTYQLEIAKKAKEAGAKSISLISAVGANSNSKNYYLKTIFEVLGKMPKIFQEKYIVDSSEIDS